MDKRRYDRRNGRRHARPLAAISIAAVTVCMLAACASPPAAQGHDGFRRAFAQVRGITWAACAATMEVALRRRLAGVAQISISQSQQTAEVTFMSGTPAFSAAAFSEAVAEAEVNVVTLEVDVCGVVDDQRVLRSSTGGHQPFVRLRGVNPVGTETICVRGRLDEGHEPPELEVAKSLSWD